jgi:hypothetical protein
VLQAIEKPLASRLVGGGRVFYRDEEGRVQCAARSELPQLAGRGAVNHDTTVFDTGLTTAGEWRERFEAPARATWVGDLLHA